MFGGEDGALSPERIFWDILRCQRLSEEFLNHMNHLLFKSGGLIRGGVTDVDEQEPRPLRPQQVATSDRSDRRRMGTGRTSDPAGQDWRWQAHGDHAGGGERSQ